MKVVFKKSDTLISVLTPKKSTKPDRFLKDFNEAQRTTILTRYYDMQADTFKNSISLVLFIEQYDSGERLLDVRWAIKNLFTQAELEVFLDITQEEIDDTVSKWEQTSGGLTVLSTHKIADSDLPTTNFRFKGALQFNEITGVFSYDLTTAKAIQVKRVRALNPRKKEEYSLEYFEAEADGDEARKAEVRALGVELKAQVAFLGALVPTSLQDIIDAFPANLST